MVLISPGMLILRIIYATGVHETITSTVASEIIFTTVVFGISSIPFIIFGILLGSKNKKGTAVILFILYVILLIIGLPIWSLAWTP